MSGEAGARLRMNWPARVASGLLILAVLAVGTGAAIWASIPRKGGGFDHLGEGILVLVAFLAVNVLSGVGALVGLFGLRRSETRVGARIPVAGNIGLLACLWLGVWALQTNMEQKRQRDAQERRERMTPGELLREVVFDWRLPLEERSRRARELIALGASIDADEGQTWSPLAQAAYGSGYEPEHRALDTVRMILDLGANVRWVGKHGETALYTAAMHGSAECVALLLDRGANPQVRTADGETALDVARRVDKRSTGRGAVIELLLKYAK